MVATCFLLLAATSPEAVILDEINELRRDPAAYSQKLERYLDWFDGRILRPPGAEPVRTKEGAAAVREAIEALRKSPRSPALSPHEGLGQHARALAERQGATGEVGHVRPTSSDLKEWRFRSWGQNITYGPMDPRRIVADQLIDDGVPDRGHRRNLLDPRFSSVGISCRPHRDQGHLCVLNLGAP